MVNDLLLRIHLKYQIKPQHLKLDIIDNTEYIYYSEKLMALFFFLRIHLKKLFKNNVLNHT